MTKPNLIEIQTLKYWELSRCWNNQKDSKIYNVQEGIKMMNGVMESVNPARPVSQLAFQLQQAIIHKPDKKSKAKTEVKVKAKANSLSLALVKGDKL